MKRLSLVAALLVILCLTQAADASVSIPGLYNTGVNNASALLTNGAVDPHYSLTLAPAVVTTDPNAYTYANLTALYNVYPGSWVGNTATSQWIGPTPNIVLPSDPNWSGEYHYDLTFDLTGLDPSTASLSGLWSSDNGSQIWLNGVYTGYTKSSTGYHTLDAFTLSSGFVAGVNTLQFVVFNSLENLAVNPTGLQVSALQGTADLAATPAAVDPVPEAGMLATWSLGLALVVGLQVRRRALGRR